MSGVRWYVSGVIFRKSICYFATNRSRLIGKYANKQMLVGVYLDKDRVSDTPVSAETGISAAFSR